MSKRRKMTPSPEAVVTPISTVREREITAKEFTRTLGPLGNAFLVEQRLAGRLRKQTRSAWVEEFEAWKSAPIY